MRPGQAYSMLPTSMHICKFSRKRGCLQVFCFEVHDFTVVDLFIHGFQCLFYYRQSVTASVGIEGSISNIIVSIDS